MPPIQTNANTMDSVLSEIKSESMESFVREVKSSGIPSNWTVGSDFANIQARYSLKQKGWLRKVEWKDSPIEGAGCGVFAAEFLQRGALLRCGRRDENFLVFDTEDDLPPLTESTIQYLSWYMHGRDGRVGVFVPGCSFNHGIDGDENIQVKWESRDEFNVVATRDIQPGEEVLADYRTFGKPPAWVYSFAKKYNVPFVWQGLNEFI